MPTVREILQSNIGTSPAGASTATPSSPSPRSRTMTVAEALRLGQSGFGTTPALATPSNGIIRPPTPTTPTGPDIGFLEGAGRAIHRGALGLAAASNVSLYGPQDTQDIADIARYYARLNSPELAPSRAAQKFIQDTQDKGAWDVLKAAWDNPSGALETLIEAAPSLAVSVIGSGIGTAIGAIGGAVAGAPTGPGDVATTATGALLGARLGLGLTSFLTEYGQDVLDSVYAAGQKKLGPVPNDPEGRKEWLRRAMADKDILSEARAKGRRKGAIVGLLDAIFPLSGEGKVAGRSAARIVAGKSAQAMIAGASGQYFGSKAIGQKPQMRDVLAEALIQIPSSAFEIATATHADIVAGRERAARLQIKEARDSVARMVKEVQNDPTPKDTAQRFATLWESLDDNQKTALRTEWDVLHAERGQPETDLNPLTLWQEQSKFAQRKALPMPPVDAAKFKKRIQAAKSTSQLNDVARDVEADWGRLTANEQISLSSTWRAKTRALAKAAPKVVAEGKNAAAQEEPLRGLPEITGINNAIPEIPRAHENAPVKTAGPSEQISEIPPTTTPPKLTASAIGIVPGKGEGAKHLPPNVWSGTRPPLPSPTEGTKLRAADKGEGYYAPPARQRGLAANMSRAKRFVGSNWISRTHAFRTYDSMMDALRIMAEGRLPKKGETGGEYIPGGIRGSTARMTEHMGMSFHEIGQWGLRFSNEVLKPWRKATHDDWREFDTYTRMRTVKARYYERRNAAGDLAPLDTTVSLEDANAFIRAFEAKNPVNKQYGDKYFALWNEFMHSLADESPRIAKFIEKLTNRYTTDYVPNQFEFMSDLIAPELRMTAAPEARLKKLVGGGPKGARTYDPIATAMAKMHYLISLAHTQDVLDAVMETKRQNADVWEKAAKTLGIDAKPTEDQIAALMPVVRKSLGVNSKVISDIDLHEMLQFASPPGMEKGSALFPTYDPATGRPMQVALPVELVRGLQGVDPRAVAGAFRLVMSGLTRVFRAGTTGLSLVFGGRNPIWDVQSAYMQTLSDAKLSQLFGEWAKTMALGAAQKSDLIKMAKEWGIYSSAYTMQHVPSGGVDVGAMFGEHAWRNPLRVLDKAEYYLAMTEAVTRATAGAMLLQTRIRNGDYDIPGLRLRDRAHSTISGNWLLDGDGTKVMRLKPLFDSLTRDQHREIFNEMERITTDFRDQGFRTQVMNQIVPYFSAAIAGTRQAVQSWRRSPRTAVLKGLAFITAPTLALWVRNRDQEWYKDDEAAAKYYFYRFKIGDTIVRAPKIRDWGQLFGTIPEAILNAWYQKDPQEVTRAFGFILNTMSPIEPSPVGAPVEAALGIPGQYLVERYANKTLWSNRPIETEAEKQQPAAERFGPYTTPIALVAGRTLNWSPKKIDHALRTFFGRMPNEYINGVLFFTKLAQGKRPPFSEAPVAGGFVQRGGTGGGQSRAINQVYQDKKRLMELRRSSKQELTPEQVVYLQRLTATTAKLKNLRRQEIETDDASKRSELGNRMRDAALAVLQQRPASLEPAAAPPEKATAKRFNSITREIRAVLLQNARDKYRKRLPNASEQRITRLAQRDPKLRRMTFLSRRFRMAERRGDDQAMQRLLTELEKLQSGI